MTSLLTDTRERLKRQGFRLPDAPESDAPSVPDHVTDMSDDALMDMFAEFSAWLAYAQSTLAVAEVREREAEVNLEQTKAEETVRGLGQDERVTVAAKVGLTSKAVQDAQEKHLEAYAHRKFLNAVSGGFERAIALLSREVTRRVSRNPSENRMHKWGGA